MDMDKKHRFVSHVNTQHFREQNFIFQQEDNEHDSKFNRIPYYNVQLWMHVVC